MNDISSSLAPQNILRLFNTADQLHAYNTRSSSRRDHELYINEIFKTRGQNMELHTSEY